MSKIYKSFDEYLKEQTYMRQSYKTVANEAWLARQPEIEQLKHQITKLEFSEEDAQQHAKKVKEENEQLLTSIENISKWHLSITDTLLKEIGQLKQQRKEQEAIIQKLNMDRYDLQQRVREALKIESELNDTHFNICKAMVRSLEGATK